jgi:hypothetical protein
MLALDQVSVRGMTCRGAKATGMRGQASVLPLGPAAADGSLLLALQVLHALVSFQAFIWILVCCSIKAFQRDYFRACN